MIPRPMARGGRKPVVVDLMIGVVVASLLAAGLRSLRSGDLDATQLLVASSSMFGILAIAALYGMAAAFEMRRGWLAASLLTGMLYALLVLGSMAGIAALAILDPTTAGLTVAAEGTVLLWSSSWL